MSNCRNVSDEERELLRIATAVRGGLKRYAQATNQNESFVRFKASLAGLKVRDKRTYFVQDDFFNYWNEATAYWIGFIAADGCLRSEEKAVVIDISEKDRAHLIKLQERICPMSPIRTRIAHCRTGNFTNVVLRFHSNEIYDRLLAIGLSPRKSLTLEFPGGIPQAEMCHFIRGYSDGDGCFFLRATKGHRALCWKLVGTENFLTGVRDTFIREGIAVRSAIRSHGVYYSIQVEGCSAVAIASYLYRDATIFLERKRLG